MKLARFAAMTAAMVMATVTAQAQITSAICTGTGSAHAGGCVVQNIVSSTVPYVARMTLSQGLTTLVAPAVADFNTPAGVNTLAALTLTVNSNAAYKITAAAAATNFTGGSGNKLAGDLTYTVDGGTTFQALAGAGTTLGTLASATASTVYTIGYNTKYSWTIDTPGTYTLALNYTLTAP